MVKYQNAIKAANPTEVRINSLRLAWRKIESTINTLLSWAGPPGRTFHSDRQPAYRKAYRQLLLPEVPGALPLVTILERLRNELRKRGFLPIVFNFDKPETKDFTETIRLLAGLSHFVIAEITNPRSAPLELQATVPEIMIPFVPIIEEGEKPFAMLKDLWLKHRDWMFEPIYYSSLDRLVDALDTEIIKPAEVRFAELLARKAEEPRETLDGTHTQRKAG